MTSRSTIRRRERDTALIREWEGTPVGQRVTVRRANGEVLKTITQTSPFALETGAYVVVDGISGNTALHRVTRGWNP